MKNRNRNRFSVKISLTHSHTGTAALSEKSQSLMHGSESKAFFPLDSLSIDIDGVARCTHANQSSEKKVFFFSTVNSRFTRIPHVRISEPKEKEKCGIECAETALIATDFQSISFNGA